MVKVVLGALGAVMLIGIGSVHAANYGPQYGRNYDRGFVPNSAQQYSPNYAPVPSNPRYAPHRFAPRKAAPQQPAQDGNDPAAKVSKQLANLRTFLSKSQGTAISQAQAMQYIEQQIAPDIDFATMTQMALGHLGNRMSTQQRTAAQSQLRRNFTAKLIEAMGDIRSTRFTVGKTRRGTSRGELVVPVRLDRWRGQPLKISFRFYKTNDGWKVFDAEAGGQSAVMFYRGYFARQWRGG